MINEIQEEGHQRPDVFKFNYLAYESILDNYAEREKWLNSFLEDEISDKGNPPYNTLRICCSRQY